MHWTRLNVGPSCTGTEKARERQNARERERQREIVCERQYKRERERETECERREKMWERDREIERGKTEREKLWCARAREVFRPVKVYTITEDHTRHEKNGPKGPTGAHPRVLLF